MSYQPVRGFFQKLTYDALVSAGVAAADIHFDNFGETAAPADRSYAVVAMSFGQGIDNVVGCEGLENLNGSLQCNIYTPKQQGSKPGEDISLEVVKEWSALNRRTTAHPGLEQAACLSIDGPQTLAPDQRPHHVNVISCVWKARVG